MDYSIAPFGDFWSGGVFSVPCAVTEKYIKLASEYQLKALLIILNGRGRGSSSQIAKTLGITAADAEELMEFWIAEGVVLTLDGTNAVPEQPADSEEKAPERAVIRMDDAPPTLSPKDITDAANENDEIGDLLNEAQSVLGRTLSLKDSEMLVNMVNFYGLGSEIILMILEYCRSLREKGRTVGTAYILKIAKNWMEEGIDSVAAAEEKLKSIENSDRLWKEIAALAGITHRKPTQKQREMVLRWSEDFSFEMISLAIEIMKENTASPKLGYADKILKNWKSAGIKTPADAEAENKKFENSKTDYKEIKNTVARDRVGGKPSFNLEEIKKDAQNNTDIKF